MSTQAKPISEVVKDFEQSLENLRPSTRRAYVAGARAAIRAASLELWQRPSATDLLASIGKSPTEKRARISPFLEFLGGGSPKISVSNEEIAALQSWVIQTIAKQMRFVKNPSIASRRDTALIASICAAPARGNPRKWPVNCLKITETEVLLWDAPIQEPIAGVDPNKASVGSTAWAKFIVDGDLSFQIDAREIPTQNPPWSTGYVPLGRSTPYEAPAPPFESINGHQVYQLNGGLVDWAFQQTANITLPDDANLQQVRAQYPTFPNALKPPFVLEGDDLAADTFWLGDLLNTWAENWISYWTVNKGSFAMGDFEDAGVGQALQFLTQAGKADQNRLLILRSASDYTVQPQGQTPAQFLFNENNGGLSGFQESLNDVYQVGSTVVKTLSTHWDQYQNNIPHFP